MSRPNDNAANPFPVKLLAVGLALTVAVLFAMIWSAFDSFRNAITVQLRDLRLEELSGRIVHLDEVLTMSARMASATGDLQWEQRYRRFEPELDAAIKETTELTVRSENAEATAQTDAANQKLVEMENQAFALVRAGQAAQAAPILFGEAYEAQKKIYADGIAHLLGHIKDDLALSQQNKRQHAILFITASVLSIVLLLITWIMVWRKLHRWRAAQAANFTALAMAEVQIRIAHRDLEKRVEDRTRELQQEIAERKHAEEALHEAQSELLATARQAGMAEIATNVLHNVGNVLNSVNVSAGLVSSQMRDSKTHGLARAVQLMNEHAADLGEFLTHDEKGKLLPGYLNKLVAALAAEQRSIIEELGSLSRSVDHIKDIVATQQSYAGTASVVEAVQVRALLEDALRMHAGALTRHRVTIVREFADVPVLLLDRHRVLEILVNLISNAKQAMDGVLDRLHRITLRVDIADGAEGPRLRICVEDEGEGIAPQHMARLFVHGFTTRKNGHGYGLHSCALAAKEMGGTLTAHSEGPGQGATFTLELPIKTSGDPQ